jgi:lipoyl(octanoyl) transferase
MNEIQFKELGILAYKEALNVQLEHFEQIKNLKIQNREQGTSLATPNYFFFVEHPHVYTMGKNGDITNVLLSSNQLKEKKIAYYHTNRGGDSTYHGPGQIVGYPILDLDNFFSDIHTYMRKLEEVIILTIAEYGLKGERSEGETGVWLDARKPSARKICAMGVHTSRWITMHGFALNVNTDLSYFNGIIPCGITNKGVTSLAKELGKEIDEGKIKKSIIKNFSAVFQTNFIDYREI